VPGEGARHGSELADSAAVLPSAKAENAGTARSGAGTISEALSFLRRFPNSHFANSRIPRLIHRIWISDPLRFPVEARSSVASFQSRNEAVLQLVWSGQACAEFVDAYYPSAAKAFRALPHAVLQADLFRYMVLNTFGGVYSDIDTTLLRSVDEWVSSDLDPGDPVSLIIGVEADLDSADWDRWYARRLQWCQWTIGATAGHPVLRYVIDESLRRIRLAQARSVAELTGPGVWTDSVNRWLEQDQGRSWSEFLGLAKAVRVGDAALLTITAFSPGRGTMGSEPTSSPRALVEHGFMGSWKRPLGRDAGKRSRTMSDAHPRKADQLEVNEADDGLVVYDTAHDMVHHLNPSASLIFDVCDGTRDAEAIARILAEAYALGAPATDEALAGLTQLADRMLIHWGAPGEPQA
jgi:alpha 1,6-mannosyltransferase